MDAEYRTARWSLALGVVLALVGAAWAGAPTPTPPGDAARGALVAGLAGCPACHTADGGAPYAGGYRIDTDFGVFVGTNLTPDPEHGLGAWTREDFGRALREGRSPDGTRYWPAFPFTSFTGLSDGDLSDLWAHLRAQTPSPRPDEPHELSRGRGQLALWRPLAFHPRGPMADDDEREPAWNRGRYLVEVVGHCGECHTPRGRWGGLKRSQGLTGNSAPPEPAPDITAGTLGWSHGEWVDFLELGMTPAGDFVGGEMGRVVREGTAPLPGEDRAAMATYLLDPGRFTRR